MKVRNYLRHAPKVPDMKTKYRARVCGIRFSGTQVICDWTIYTPKTRKKKSKTVSKQTKSGG